MTIELYTVLRNDLEKQLNLAQEGLDQFFRDSSGRVERTPEYLNAKKLFNSSFKKLQILNQKTPNSIKREWGRARRK